MKLIHVTEVTSPWMDFGGVSEEKLFMSSVRGLTVHQAIAAKILGLYVPPIPPGFQGYWQSFLKFFPRIKTVVSVEGQYKNDEFGITGTVDFLGEIKESPRPGLSIVDWKTPITGTRAWACQCAAYKFLTKAENAGSLILRENGRPPKMIWFDNDLCALPAFFSGLNILRYMKEG